jgi:hypothetical protein
MEPISGYFYENGATKIDWALGLNLSLVNTSIGRCRVDPDGVWVQASVVRACHWCSYKVEPARGQPRARPQASGLNVTKLSKVPDFGRGFYR